MTREELRILAHKQLIHYFQKSRKILPANEVLTNVDKIDFLLTPICTINQDVAVKLTVSLQLAYKTIQNLGTEKHGPWLKRMENGDDLSCFALTELARRRSMCTRGRHAVEWTSRSHMVRTHAHMCLDLSLCALTCLRAFE